MIQPFVSLLLEWLSSLPNLRRIIVTNARLPHLESDPRGRFVDVLTHILKSSKLKIIDLDLCLASATDFGIVQSSARNDPLNLFPSDFGALINSLNNLTVIITGDKVPDWWGGADPPFHHHQSILSHQEHLFKSFVNFFTPNLHHLNLYAPLPFDLKHLHAPSLARLQTIRLSNFRVDAEQLNIVLTTSSALRTIYLHRIYLKEGGWKDVFNHLCKCIPDEASASSSSSEAFPLSSFTLSHVGYLSPDVLSSECQLEVEIEVREFGISFSDWWELEKVLMERREKDGELLFADFMALLQLEFALKVWV